MEQEVGVDAQGARPEASDVDPAARPVSLSHGHEDKRPEGEGRGTAEACVNESGASDDRPEMSGPEIEIETVEDDLPVRGAEESDRGGERPKRGQTKAAAESTHPKRVRQNDAQRESRAPAPPGKPHPRSEADEIADPAEATGHAPVKPSADATEKAAPLGVSRPDGPADSAANKAAGCRRGERVGEAGGEGRDRGREERHGEDDPEKKREAEMETHGDQELGWRRKVTLAETSPEACGWRRRVRERTRAPLARAKA